MKEIHVETGKRGIFHDRAGYSFTRTRARACHLRTEPGVAANLHGCRAYLTSGNVTAGALR